MSLLYYTLLRILMLVSVGGLAYAFGMRGFLLLVVAFVGSGIISYFVLDRIRNNAGQQLGGFFHRINDRIDAATRAEDDDEDEQVDATTPEPSSSTTADSPDNGTDNSPTDSDNRSN